MRSRVRGWIGRHLAPIVYDDPVPEPGPPADVLEMLRRLGGAMCDGGEAADYIAEHLDRIAQAYDAGGVSFFVLPTGFFVRIDQGGVTRADFAAATGTPLRLDQIGALYTLVHQAERRQLHPVEVVDRLDALLAAESRFARPTRVLGLVALTVGLGLVIDPTARALPAYVVLALVVAAVQLLSERVRSLAVVLPVAAAFVVSVVAYEVAGPWFDTDPTTVLVPPLVTFLPGAALTIGTVELATGSIISGASRLMSGLVQLLLLAFGITAGAATVGEFETPSNSVTHLGWWAPWIGVVVFGVGHVVYSSAPRGSFGWLLLILLAAYGAQVAGAAAWGAVVSGFTGALVVPPLARWVESRREGPPGLVTFLPAFWLLVPGALGVAGVAEIVGATGTASLTDFVDTIVTVLAVALGVLVGTTLTLKAPRLRRSRAA